MLETVLVPALPSLQDAYHIQPSTRQILPFRAASSGKVKSLIDGFVKPEMLLVYAAGRADAQSITALRIVTVWLSVLSCCWAPLYHCLYQATRTA